MAEPAQEAPDTLPGGAELLEGFRQVLREDDYSPNTRQSYLRFVEPFLDDNPRPEQLDRYDVGRYILTWHNQFSKNTMKLATSALIKFYKYLKFFHGYRQADEVINHIRDLKGEFFRTQPFNPDPMNEKELQTLFQYTLGDNNRAIRRRCMVTILLGTGLRVSEFCRLKKDQIVTHEPGVQSHIMVAGGKTASAHRKIPLHRDFKYTDRWILGERVTEALDRYREVRPPARDEADDEYYFLSERGTPISRRSVQSMFTRLCKKSGLQEERKKRDESTLSVHNLRHTFATRLAMQGANAHQIKAILGHASVATSQAYIRLLERVGPDS